ncbi:MAG: NADP-dependent oxidoreductase [Ilumatobacteraceae bacterium]
MSAVVVATAFGGPEVLELIDEEVRSPGPGEVLLEVRAAGVNPVDYKLYSGTFGSNPAQLPMRIGSEAAGVVVAVGEGAAGPRGPVAVGDEVIAYRAPGAYAERLIVAGEAIVPKPPAMGWAAASGLLLAGGTAVHALDVIGLGLGDTVLIHAAAGGVGLLAVQLATVLGATMIGTTSVRNHDLLRRLGAIPTTYGEGLAARVRALAPDGVDAAIDGVGSDEAIDVSLELVADRNRIATIAGFQRGVQSGIKVLGGAPGADPGTEIRAAARLQLVDLVSAGRIEVLVDSTFPLARAADAHRAVMSAHTTGKVALIP